MTRRTRRRRRGRWRAATGGGDGGIESTCRRLDAGEVFPYGHLSVLSRMEAALAIGSFMSFATLLYRKLRGAAPDVRTLVLAHIKEAQDTGLIPLGMRTDDGGPSYVWLLFDRSRLTLAERERFIRDRTPP